MKRLKLETQTSRTGVAETSPANAELKIALIYQDFEMALRGKRICDLIARRSGANEEAGLSLWRYDLLHEPAFALAATHAAEHADVVVVAAKADEPLSPTVLGWLRQWPEHRKTGVGALVAVFDLGAANAANSTVSELRNAAARGRMDFFCDADFRSDDVPVGISAVNSSASAAPAGRAYWTEQPHGNFRGWGINE